MLTCGRKEVKNIKDTDKIIKKLKKETSEHWLSKGIMQFPLGSIYRYIHEDWLRKGLNARAIKENVYGMFVPVAISHFVEEEVAKYGRHKITEKKEVLDMSIFNAFYEAYEKFKYAKEKELEERNGVIV